MIECPADEFVPLPTKAAGASATAKLSYADIRTRAHAAIHAASLLADEGYADDTEDLEFSQVVARGMMRQVAKGQDVPSAEVAASMNTPAGAVFVETLLSAYDMEVVREAKRLRHYVTNKLLVESENADARIRMKALELLGKISDVGLFTERTEITVNNRSTVELENSLRDKLRRLMNKDAAEDAKIIAPPIEVVAPARPSDLLIDL